MAAKRFAYYLGLDLGQAQDYTALAIIEEPVWDGARWLSPARIDPETMALLQERTRLEGRPANPVLSVRHLERYELGTRYSEVVERVREIAYTSPLAGKPGCLMVDKTGVGAAVLDASATPA
jgi:hypothetical protein